SDGGHLIAVVPGLPALFGTIDRALGLRRRYEREELAERLRRAGFAVDQISFFNLPAALAWYVNSRLLRRSEVPAVQAWLNDRLVPLLRLEEHVRLPWGLSLLAIARKEGRVQGFEGSRVQGFKGPRPNPPPSNPMNP